MLELLLEPFSYDYMFKAIALSGVIGHNQQIFYILLQICQQPACYSYNIRY